MPPARLNDTAPTSRRRPRAPRNVSPQRAQLARGDSRSGGSSGAPISSASTRVARALQRDEPLERARRRRGRARGSRRSPQAQGGADGGGRLAGGRPAPGVPQTASAAVERGERQPQRLGELGARRSSSSGSPETSSALGGERGRVVLEAEEQLARGELVAAGGAERGQQVEARARGRSRAARAARTTRAKRRSGVQPGSPVKAASWEPARAAQAR